MRLFVASLGTETNTFSPIPTSYENFKEGHIYRPGEHPEDPKLVTAPLTVGRRRSKAEGWTLIEGSCFWAEPAGTVAKSAYEKMRDEILGQLKAALPVDGVMLGLHGAMVADGYDDCEGDLIARARALVGAKVPISVELDPHNHMTRERVKQANIIICYKEFPHTDFAERAEELVEFTLQAAQGKIKPVMSVFDCRMIASFPTSIQPMRGFVDKIMALEGKNGVLSISVGHCFPYADVPEVGAKILVVTDNRKAEGDALAEDLGKELWSMRGRTTPPYHTPDEAIDTALAGGAYPVVMADPSDNAGGGAPSDSTVILRRLIERKVDGAALAPIWDPIAVRFCFDAGEGAKLKLRFGGKTAPTSGQPVDAEVTIVKLIHDATQNFSGATVPLGDAALIRLGGIEVVLISKRTQALGTDLFTSFGVDLAKKKIIVVKSTNHFYAAYSKVAKQVLYVDSGGPIPRDHREVPYTRVQRPIWPLDDHPHPTLLN
jgi:microcystin degradation protein MlrC